MDSLTPPHPPTSSPWAVIAPLVLAVIVLAVSVVSLLWLLLTGFVFDPDDFPPEYYLALADEHRQRMLLSLLAPAASLALAGISWFSASRLAVSAVGAYWTAGLSVVLALAMVFVGTGNINGALYFAELFGGYR